MLAEFINEKISFKRNTFVFKEIFHIYIFSYLAAPEEYYLSECYVGEKE